MSEKKRHYSLFPKPLAGCVEPLTRQIFKERGLASTRLLSAWPQIVGPRLAEHCLPEKISYPQGKKTDGTLTVAVKNGFAPEIQHMQPLILEKLAAYFGYRAVSRISISHSFHTEPAPKKPRKSAPPIEARVEEQVEDPELRAALESLAQTLSKPRA